MSRTMVYVTIYINFLVAIGYSHTAELCLAAFAIEGDVIVVAVSTMAQRNTIDQYI